MLLSTYYCVITVCLIVTFKISFFFSLLMAIGYVCLVLGLSNIDFDISYKYVFSLIPVSINLAIFFFF